VNQHPFALARFFSKLLAPTSQDGFLNRSLEFGAFHYKRTLPIRRGRGRREGEQFFVRFCFPDAATADAFRDQFGGERVTSTPTKPTRRVSKQKRRYEPRTFERQGHDAR
jgi:hypothetical protein